LEARGAVEFRAYPALVCGRNGIGSAELFWHAPGVRKTAVTSESPDGDILTDQTAAGAYRVNRVKDGATYFLLDITKGAGTRRQLGKVRISVDPHCGDLKSNEPPLVESSNDFWINPNALKKNYQIAFSATPKVICSSNGLGSTQLAWKVSGPARVEVHIDRPDGVVFGGGANEGTAKTGVWVNDGMKFYLQDVSEDAPLDLENTLARITVHVPRGGC
jgi:hypothetical protein